MKFEYTYIVSVFFHKISSHFYKIIKKLIKRQLDNEWKLSWLFGEKNFQILSYQEEHFQKSYRLS